MKRVFFALAGIALFACGPAHATPGWDEPSSSAMPQEELSYGAIPPPSLAERQQTIVAAKEPDINGPGNVIPNGPLTANPPGSGASSQATLTEHGEKGSTSTR